GAGPRRRGRSRIGGLGLRAARDHEQPPSGGCACLLPTARIRTDEPALREGLGASADVTRATGPRSVDMNPKESLPYRAKLEEYQQQADALFAALRAGDEAAAWRF